MKDSRGKIIYTYDGRNRLSSAQYENGILMNYRYDPVGNLVDCVVSSHAEAVAADPSFSNTLQPVHIFERKSICPGCNTPVIPGNRFCRNCGAEVSPIAPITPNPAAVCPKCGQQLKSGKKFCPQCGTNIV